MQITSRLACLIACSTCLLVLAFSFTPLAHQLLSTFGAFEISQNNQNYLQHASQANRSDLHVLSESFAILEVLSSAELGIRLVVEANIEVGQSLQSLSKALGIAMAVTLAASVLIECWSLVLSMCDHLAPILLQASLAFCALAFATRMNPAFDHFKRASQDIAELMILGFLVVYFVFPYAVNLTGWLAQGILSSHSTLNPQQKGAADAIMAIRPTEDAVTFWSDSKNWRLDLTTLYQSASDHTHLFFDYTVSSFAHSILSGVAFPLVAFGMIWTLVRSGMKIFKEAFS